jgi:type VII secretion-associated serine protease mycosin
MRRLAGVVLAAAFAAVTLAALTLVAGASTTSASQMPGLAGQATPSPTSSPKPSRSARPAGPTVPPPTQQAAPPGPPEPVQGMPKPSANCVSQRGRSHLTSEPWAQRALDFSSVWHLTRGQHVTVAVVDSGIDYTPQLAGRVSRTDLTGGNGEDCAPHGTQVASIIAASDARAERIPFYGVAPAAHILAIRVQPQDTTGSLTNAARRRVLLNIANGIHYAAVKHAKVINVSIQVSASYPALRAAVEFALHHNAVVVAAAGNDGGGQGPFYPASYPGVLSVNAVDQNGRLGNFDVSGTPVSVTAPGVDVASDYPGGFDPVDKGTSFAAAFVSGEAALVRAAYPRLSPAQVVHRIIATAAGGTGAHTGAGMINPVQAVTEMLPPPAAAAASAASRVPVPRPQGVSSAARTVAFSVTGGAFAVAALVAIGAIAVPMGRRRHWRPGRLGTATALAAPSEARRPPRPKHPTEPQPPDKPKRPAPGQPPAAAQDPPPGHRFHDPEGLSLTMQDKPSGSRKSQPPAPSQPPGPGRRPAPIHPATAGRRPDPSQSARDEPAPVLPPPAKAGQLPGPSQLPSPIRPYIARPSPTPGQPPAPGRPTTAMPDPVPDNPPADAQPPGPKPPRRARHRRR